LLFSPLPILNQPTNQKARVTEAIEKLEAARDEYMNTTGLTSTDDELFSSLTARTEEIKKEAAAREAKKARLDAKARGVEDLFDNDDDDEDATAAATKDDDSGKSKTSKRFDPGPANRRNKKKFSFSDLPTDEAVPPEEDEDLDDQDDGLLDNGGDQEGKKPNGSTDEDIERLNRMFGKS